MIELALVAGVALAIWTVSLTAPLWPILRGSQPAERPAILRAFATVLQARFGR